MSNARLWPVDNETYHADGSAISHSGLDLVIESPALYWWQKLSGKYVREEKKHFDDGNDLDDAILRPCKTCGDGVVEIPRDVLSKAGSKVGKKWKAFEAENAGKVLLKDGEPLLQWVRAIQGHRIARSIIEGDCRFQETIVWHDDEFGVDRRARFDLIQLGEDLIGDLKTTRTGASPRECANEAAKFGYHRQQAFYKDAAEAMYGKRPEFVFIFLSKQPPHRVEVVRLDDEFERIGKEQNNRGLAQYAECLRSGKWLPETHGVVVDVAPPGWLRYSGEWEFSNV